MSIQPTSIPLTIRGSIVSVNGSTILAKLPSASVGDLCWIDTQRRGATLGQIISFHDNLFSLALFETAEGISPGTTVKTRGSFLKVGVGEFLLGRVIDPLGNPLDDLPSPPSSGATRPIFAQPPLAASRPLIDAALTTGVRSIDAVCPLGHGQRLGICASAGVGKSTLLGMIARQADVDVTVVGLVGERGREVREFLEETLGADGLTRSVVVVATSDQSPLLRQTAPYTATTIAEYFRDQGKRVLLIIDSLTRLARAIRETSLAAGEVPVRHGYTTSVYTELPRLLERAGTSPNGSITAIYTVLTNTDDDIDPMADEIKSLLDGHISLRNEISNLGILPAIDITQSVSRIARRLLSDDTRQASRGITHAFSRLIRERDIIALGGTPDRELRGILAQQDSIISFLAQKEREVSCREDTERGLKELWEKIQHTS